jgi:hypothetical protein
MLGSHRRFSSESESCATARSSAYGQPGLRGGSRLRSRPAIPTTTNVNSLEPPTDHERAHGMRTSSDDDTAVDLIRLLAGRWTLEVLGALAVDGGAIEKVVQARSTLAFSVRTVRPTCDSAIAARLPVSSPTPEAT